MGHERFTVWKVALMSLLHITTSCIEFQPFFLKIDYQKISGINNNKHILLDMRIAR